MLLTNQQLRRIGGLSEQIRPVRYIDGALTMIDQTQLPGTLTTFRLNTVEEVWLAIREMRVRGAPAIGIAAAYGYAMAVRDVEDVTLAELHAQMVTVRAYLETARPTAVNLFWALARMERVLLASSEITLQDGIRDTSACAFVSDRVMEEACLIQEEDEAACKQMGEHLLTLMQDGMGILTHCNTGALATSQYGTALAGMYVAKERGWQIHVYADETRPLLQGARLTAWELQQAGIDVTLICDNMAATVMAQGKVQAVMVGADRIACNGDVANKIGTLGVAVLAKHFGIPFYVAAPLSTIDLFTSEGSDITIEERSGEEVTESWGRRTAPADVSVYNPAFDVTPYDLITAIVTERGICYPPFQQSLSRVKEI